MATAKSADGTNKTGAEDAAAPHDAERAETGNLFSRQPSHINVLRSLLPFVWPEGRRDLRLRVVIALVALVIAKIITVLIPVSYKAIVDWLTGNAAGGEAVLNTLPWLPIMFLVAYGVGRILMMVFNQVRDVLFASVAQHAVRQLTNRTFRHLHALSLRFHLERRTGGLSRVIERAIRSIELIFRMGVVNMFPTVVELVFIAGMLFYYFGGLTMLIILVTVGLYMWFTLKASEWRIAIRRVMNDSDTDANSKAVDSLLNYETVKYFGNEELESRRFDASIERYEAAAVRTYYTLGLLNSGQAVIFSTGLTIVMVMSAFRVASGDNTVGDFVMLNALLIQLYMPLNFMGTVYREIRQGLVDLETMFVLLDEEPEIEDRPGATELVVSNGHVRFDNVSFAYDANRPILKNVSFDVPPGSMVAIVGASGAGKSTISRILFRFYDVSEGAVTIDGQDISDVTQASLRKAIGVVPQDTVLFNESIAYNIQYGRADATREEVQEAAQLAQIDGFIADLPSGYDTQVGERGLKLSGGEKQRVAIARTILKGPPILMLDEATSALDSYTEKEIQTALDQVSKDRTTLVIAHRLSTIVEADTIIVLERGAIKEQGTHAELIGLDGLYAGMWNRQREADEARERLASALEDGIITPREGDLTFSKS